MRKKLLAVILCASMFFPASVSAEVLGYEATLDTYTKEKKTPQQFQIDDGAGNTVNALAKSDTLYVTAKNTEIRSNPGDSGTELRSVIPVSYTHLDVYKRQIRSYCTDRDHGSGRSGAECTSSGSGYRSWCCMLFCNSENRPGI